MFVLHRRNLHVYTFTIVTIIIDTKCCKHHVTFQILRYVDTCFDYVNLSPEDHMLSNGCIFYIIWLNKCKDNTVYQRMCLINDA